MDKDSSVQFKLQEVPDLTFENPDSPSNLSNRGSSFDIEECFNNMNSISNVNPRFAVEIDTFSISYTTDTFGN